LNIATVVVVELHELRWLIGDTGSSSSSSSSFAVSEKKKGFDHAYRAFRGLVERKKSEEKFVVFQKEKEV
jgi:hypothetical protein